MGHHGRDLDEIGVYQQTQSTADEEDFSFAEIPGGGFIVGDHLRVEGQDFLVGFRDDLVEGVGCCDGRGKGEGEGVDDPTADLHVKGAEGYGGKFLVGS